MLTQTKRPQVLLFSEPSISETGVWSELNEGIDPAEWASLCRFIGNLCPREFGMVVKAVKGRKKSNRVNEGRDRMVGIC